MMMMLAGTIAVTACNLDADNPIDGFLYSFFMQYSPHTPTRSKDANASPNTGQADSDLWFP
jgi:hypothetical protein